MMGSLYREPLRHRYTFSFMKVVWLDAFFNLGIKGNAVLYLAERINDLGIECSHFSYGVESSRVKPVDIAAIVQLANVVGVP